MFCRMENALTQGSSNKQQKDRIPDATEHWNKSNYFCLLLYKFFNNILFTEDPLSINNDEDKICFSKYLERQRKLQPTGIISHSKQSDLLVSLLQFADSKRYNIPVTQKSCNYQNNYAINKRELLFPFQHYCPSLLKSQK